jgi:hypothetical protein
MFKKIRSEPLALVAIILMLCFALVAAKPRGVSRLVSLWVGSESDTSNLTVGNDDVFIKGLLEVQGGKYDPVNINTTETAITLTQADSGQLFYENTSGLTTGGVPIVYTLPADPTGLTFNFFLGTSSNQVAVNPDAGDTIAGLNQDYYYWASTAGSFLVVKGVNSSTWTVFGATAGAWTQANDG